MQHSRTAGYLTLATGLHFVSVGTNRVPPAPSTAKWTCKHVRLARCSREGQKKDLEKAEHFPALNLPSLVISDNTRCFHHCVDTIAALLLTTPCGIFSDVPFYSIIPAPICQCFFKGRKRGQMLLSISDLRAIRRRTRIALCPPAVASTGSLNLPVRPRPSPFPVFWGAQGMSPALRYDRCVMVVTVLENNCWCAFFIPPCLTFYGKSFILKVRAAGEIAVPCTCNPL